MKQLFVSLNSLIIFSIISMVLSGCNLIQEDEDKDDNLEVEVTVTISVNHHEVSLLVGDTLKIHHVVTPDTAKIPDLSWTSSNPQVASVSSTGKVKALSIGQTQIMVSSAAKKAQAVTNISVIPTMLNQISLESDVIAAYINEPKSLHVTYEPADATDKSLIWETTDNNIVSVDQGTITAKKLGYASITAHQSNRAIDNAVIVPAHKNQVMAANQVNVSTGEQKHFIYVYAAALVKPVTIKEVKLYLGIRGDVNSSELKTVPGELNLSPGQGGRIAIEVNAEQANQLTYGRYVRIAADIDGNPYYIYVSWTNNIEFEER